MMEQFFLNNPHLVVGGAFVIALAVPSIAKWLGFMD